MQLKPYLVHHQNQGSFAVRDWKRLTDAQINHFLDFLQCGGVVQDVASGTRTAKISTGQKTKMPKAVENFIYT